MPSFASTLSHAVTGIVVVAMVIALATIVMGYFQASINTSSLPSAAQQGISSFFSSFWSTWGLMSVLILVIVAGVIIWVVRGGFGGGEGSE